MNGFYIAILARAIKHYILLFDEKERCYQIGMFSMRICGRSCDYFISHFTFCNFQLTFTAFYLNGLVFQVKSLRRVNRRGQTAEEYHDALVLYVIYGQGVILRYLGAVTDSFWRRKYIWTRNSFSFEIAGLHFSWKSELQLVKCTTSM